MQVVTHTTERRAPGLSGHGSSVAAGHVRSFVVRASIAGAAVTAALLLALLNLAGARSAAGADALAGRSAGCQVAVDKVAAPPVLPLGAAVTVTLSVSGICPPSEGLTEVVLVIDRSISMQDPDAGGQRSKLEAAQEAARAFVEAVSLGRVRVGLVVFDASPAVAVGLSADKDALLAAIDGIRLARGTNLVDALDAGGGLLEREARPGAVRTIVFMTDGRHSGRNPPIEDIDPIIARIRGGGISTWAVGLGRPEDLDEAVLRRIADDEAHYLRGADSQSLTAIYRGIAGSINATVLLRQATVVDRLPADMAYVPGSALPPALWDAAARSLTWQLRDVPLEGLRLSFRVIPQVPGQRPTNSGASLDYRDGLDLPGRLDFPLPSVLVLAPTATPTVTPTFTATATETPRPTPRPTQPPRPIYLPRLLRQSCPERLLDLVLVLDASQSMQEGAPGGGSKLEAAVQAARGLLASLRWGPERAALVGFHRVGQRVQGLTADAAVMDAALGRLESGSGTRIDLGLRAAAEALAERRPAARAVVILLTDGRQEDGRVGAVLAAADRLAALGATVYTIGLGQDVDAGLLGLVAGRPERAYLAPSAADLGRIYREIGGALPCE